MSARSGNRDLQFMLRAISLARRGLGSTYPNPPVGAVVAAGERIIGVGWHERAGAPHAEVEALKRAGEAARGAELFVSLEPCNHQGRTPPCTAAILQAGIARVVYSVSDPNPKVSGEGGEFLRQNGILVESGVCQEQGAELLAPWCSHILRGRPYLTLKLALSVEGYLAPVNRGNVWLSSSTSLAAVQRLRSRSDAILVGANTIRLDNPRLTNRLGRGIAPLRVIVSGSGRLPEGALVFSGPEGSTLVASLAGSSIKGTEEFYLPNDKTLLPLLERLASRGISSVLCEGGGGLSEALLRERLVDRIILFKTQVAVGNGGVPWCSHDFRLNDEFSLVRRRPLGVDVLEEYTHATMDFSRR